LKIGLRHLNFSGIFENINLAPQHFLFFSDYSKSSRCTKKPHLQYIILKFLTLFSVIPSNGTELHILIDTVHRYIQYVDTHILRNVIARRKVFNLVPIVIEIVRI